MSLTTQVFGRPISGRGRVYYKITNSQDQKVSDALAKTETNPVVLMFWADWSIPSKVMMDPFRDMARAKKKEAVFCLVDVDKCKDIVERFRVEALPTFLLIKEGQEKARVVGPKVEELNTIINANIGGSSIPRVRPAEVLNTSTNTNIGGSSIPQVQLQRVEKINTTTNVNIRQAQELEDIDRRAANFIQACRRRFTNWRPQ